MKTHLPIPYKYLLIVIAGLLKPSIASAQQELAAHFERYHSTEKAITAPVVTGSTRRAEKQRLLDFLKELHVPDVPYNEPADKQWNSLAGVFTRLKLYPLAMKCYLKTLTPDSLVNDDIPVTGDDRLSVASQLKQLEKNARPANSSIIQVNHILETFQDGKSALAYAMILHVKQPIRGSAKVHKLANTGHTFITLIKFNTDSSYTTLSFGFGPRKDNLLSATPLIPSTSSKFTDDGVHEWDEVVGKFISKRRFEKVLQLTHQYDGLAYHLSTNNCTDFGLRAAQVVGLNITDTKGTWLLGGGNNPANTGESILLGKFSNADTGNLDRLYIDTARTTTVNLNRN